MAKLRRSVTVADEGGDLVVLPAGTAHNQIKRSQLDQLAPEHFDGELDDWRPQERIDADADWERRKGEETMLRLTAKDVRTREMRLEEARTRAAAAQAEIEELEAEEE